MCVHIALHEVLEFGNTAMDVEEFRRIRNEKKVFGMGLVAMPKFIQVINSLSKYKFIIFSVKPRQ